MSGALGKARIALGKGFTECYPWHKTLILVGKEVFAKCFLSDTRQRLHQILKKHSKKTEHSAKNESKKS
jgi:hypothetical protein